MGRFDINQAQKAAASAQQNFCYASSLVWLIPAATAMDCAILVCKLLYRAPHHPGGDWSRGVKTAKYNKPDFQYLILYCCHETPRMFWQGVLRGFFNAIFVQLDSFSVSVLKHLMATFKSEYTFLVNLSTLQVLSSFTPVNPVSTLHVHRGIAKSTQNRILSCQL